jgi:transposase
LWDIIEPLLPPPKPRRFRFPGRKPVEDRKVLTGILFVLKTGIPWEDLPVEMGCGCGMTCWRRLEAWNRAGVWSKLHQVLLAKLQAADKIDWSRAAVDSSFARAFGGVEGSGPNPTDRSKPGVKHHAIVDANVPEINDLLELVDSIGPVAGKQGHPKQRPEEMYGDRAYDSEPHREELRERSIEPKLAKRNTEHGSGLGIYRWVVERFFSWLRGFRKLRFVTEKTHDIVPVTQSGHRTHLPSVPVMGIVLVPLKKAATSMLRRPPPRR